MYVRAFPSAPLPLPSPPPRTKRGWDLLLLSFPKPLREGVAFLSLRHLPPFLL